MTARCEKTSLVIAQFYQSADASFFIIDFIRKIAVQKWDRNLRARFSGVFMPQGALDEMPETPKNGRW